MVKKMTNANQISLILKLAVCARVLPTDTNHKLYVDNWFNSIPLNIYMFERGIEMVGAVRRYRIVSVLSCQSLTCFTEHLILMA